MPTPLHPGDQVSFSVGRSVFLAHVIEDRGNLGIGGRQIVRIEVLPDADEEPRRFEMPAEELQPIG